MTLLIREPNEFQNYDINISEIKTVLRMKLQKNEQSTQVTW